MKNHQQQGQVIRKSSDTDVASSFLCQALDIEPPPGAHLVTPRHGYNHHGIYVGDGKVIHYAGLCGELHRGPVEEVSVACFAAGRAIWIKPSPCPKYVGSEAVRRARSRLGESEYRLLTNNCEHFCTWCLYGESCSEQVTECLAHPRVVLHVMISMVKALLTARSKAMRSAVCTARGPLIHYFLRLV